MDLLSYTNIFEKSRTKPRHNVGSVAFVMNKPYR